MFSTGTGYSEIITEMHSDYVCLRITNTLTYLFTYLEYLLLAIKVFVF